MNPPKSFQANSTASSLMHSSFFIKQLRFSLLFFFLNALIVLAYQRVDHSCLLMTEQKLACFLPENKKLCCENCIDSSPNCLSDIKSGFVFFIYKFIPCPSGVLSCRINNYEEIEKTTYFDQFYFESDFPKMVQLLEIESLACHDTHILLGTQCIERNGCKDVQVLNNQITCIKCEQGYFLSDNPKNRCQKCHSLVQHSNKETPYLSDVYCATCQNSEKCTSCISNYYLATITLIKTDPIVSAYGVCRPCASNCECSQDSPCTGCISNKFYYSPRTNSCKSCSEFVEPYLGQNLRNFLNRNSETASLDMFIISCGLPFPESIQSEPTSLLDVSFQERTFIDIIEIQFQVPVHLIQNYTIIETCEDGCGECVFEPTNERFSCIKCLNGFYQDVFETQRCLRCSAKNPEYILCKEMRPDYMIIYSTIVFPMQCKNKFIQPIYASDITTTTPRENSCSVDINCLSTEIWIHSRGTVNDQGSCKRCVYGYHRVRSSTLFNYYTCAANYDLDLDPNIREKYDHTICYSGYFYNEKMNKCEICPPNCQKCTSSTDCQQCDQLHAYSKEIGNNLLECIIPALKTTDITNCSQFQTGEFPSDLSMPRNGYCKKCRQYTQPVYEINQELGIDRIIECNSYIPFCVMYVNSTTCQMCQIGYNLRNGQCDPKPEGCALFDGFLSTCLSCKYGYKLKNNKCVSCTNISSINENGVFNCLSAAQEIYYLNQSLRWPIN